MTWRKSWLCSLFIIWNFYFDLISLRKDYQFFLKKEIYKYTIDEWWQAVFVVVVIKYKVY